MIAEAFGLEKNLIKGMLSLAKGDWVGLEALAGKICEFDSARI